jgi:hypothetical protein
MTGIDYFAWLVLIVIVVAAVWLFVALAKLPGQIARDRGHPQAEAINAAGWLGLLLTVGVVWALALIWALMKPVAQPYAADSTPGEVEALKTRIESLEARLEAAGGADR